jgi:hypothetical protein
LRVGEFELIQQLAVDFVQRQVGGVQRETELLIELQQVLRVGLCGIGAFHACEYR